MPVYASSQWAHELFFLFQHFRCSIKYRIFSFYTKSYIKKVVKIQWLTVLFREVPGKFKIEKERSWFSSFWMNISPSDKGMVQWKRARLLTQSYELLKRLLCNLLLAEPGKCVDHLGIRYQLSPYANTTCNIPLSQCLFLSLCKQYLYWLLIHFRIHTHTHMYFSMCMYIVYV